MTVWDTKLVEGVVTGSVVEIWGKLRDASYTTKEGQQRSAVEIVAESMVVHEPEKKPAPITPNLHGVPISDEDLF